jgi:hypothetical protein
MGHLQLDAVKIKKVTLNSNFFYQFIDFTVILSDNIELHYE